MTRQHLRNVRMRQRFFAICFSEKGDSLAQWRGYGAGTRGAAVGFNTAAIQSISTENYQLWKLLYNRDTQRTLVYQLTMSAERLREKSPHDLEAIARALSSALARAQLHFKNPDFESENEVRHVAGYWPDQPNPFLDFRSTPTSIIPFMPTLGKIPKNKPLPITEIILGPNVDSELMFAALPDFLRQCSFDPSKIKISKSKIPYRL